MMLLMKFMLDAFPRKKSCCLGGPKKTPRNITARRATVNGCNKRRLAWQRRHRTEGRERDVRADTGAQHEHQNGPEYHEQHHAEGGQHLSQRVLERLMPELSRRQTASAGFATGRGQGGAGGAAGEGG